MGNELQTLNERIAERIGKDLVELIPADQWQALVDGEVRKFRNDTAPKLIKQLLIDAYTEQAKSSIGELCNTDEWNSITGEMTSSKLKELIAESGGAIFGAVLTPAMGMVLQDLRNRLGY